MGIYSQVPILHALTLLVGVYQIETLSDSQGEFCATAKKAPAVTLPQVVMVLATVLPLREFDTQLALDILTYHQQRNHAAYLSHRKRRIALATQRE
jgi:hypothetical protein